MTAALIPTVESLSAEERDRFQYLEQKADAALVEVAEVWAEIRDRRLYRESHESFEAYCKDRLHRSRRSVDYAIAAAPIIKNLSSSENNCSQLPTSESQVRPLAKLLPEKQPEVWQRAVEEAGGDTPSAAQVKRAVEAQRFEQVRSLYSTLGEFERTLIRGRTRYVFNAPGVMVSFRGIDEAEQAVEAIEGKVKAFQLRTNGGLVTCHTCEHRMASQDRQTWICGAKSNIDAHVYGADQDIAAESGCLNYKRTVYGRIGKVEAAPTPLDEVKHVNHEFYRGKSVQCLVNALRTLEEWWDESEIDEVGAIADQVKELKTMLQTLDVDRASGRVEEGATPCGHLGEIAL